VTRVAVSPCAPQRADPLQSHPDKAQRGTGQPRSTREYLQLILGDLQIPGSQQHAQVSRHCDDPCDRIIFDAVHQLTRPAARFKQITGLDEQSDGRPRDEGRPGDRPDEWHRTGVSNSPLPEEHPGKRGFGASPLFAVRGTGHERRPAQ